MDFHFWPTMEMMTTTMLTSTTAMCKWRVRDLLIALVQENLILFRLVTFITFRRFMLKILPKLIFKKRKRKEKRKWKAKFNRDTLDALKPKRNENVSILLSIYYDQMKYNINIFFSIQEQIFDQQLRKVVWCKACCFSNSSFYFILLA